MSEEDLMRDFDVESALDADEEDETADPEKEAEAADADGDEKDAGELDVEAPEAEEL